MKLNKPMAFQAREQEENMQNMLKQAKKLQDEMAA